MSETKAAKLDQDARYRVKGYAGIAFFIYGFPKRWEADLALVECDEPSCECHADADKLHEEDTGEGEHVEQDEECGRVLVVMVGDDTKHEVDIEDLSPLKGSEYCTECGQIGCGWHPGEED